MVKTYLRYQPEEAFGVISNDCSSVTHPSASVVFTGCAEAVGCWSIRRGGLIKKLGIHALAGSSPAPTDPERWGGSVTALAICPLQPNLIAVGHEKGLVRVWDWTEEKIKLVFHGHRAAVTVMRFSHDGALLFTGSKDTDIIAWGITDAKGKFRLSDHTNSITDIQLVYPILEQGSNRFATSPVLLISASVDGVVRIWDLKIQTCAQTLVDVRSPVWSLCLNPQQTRLIVGSADAVLHVYELFCPSLDGKSSGHRDEVTGLTTYCKLLGTLTRANSRGGRVTGLEVIVSTRLDTNEKAASDKADPLAKYKINFRGMKFALDAPSESIVNSDENSYVLVYGQTSKVIEILTLRCRKERVKRSKRLVKRRLEKLKQKHKKSEEIQALEADLDNIMKGIELPGMTVARLAALAEAEEEEQQLTSDSIVLNPLHAEMSLGLDGSRAIVLGGKPRNLSYHERSGKVVTSFMDGHIEFADIEWSYVRREKRKKKDVERMSKKARIDSESLTTQADTDEEGGDLLNVSGAIEFDGLTGIVRHMALSHDQQTLGCLSDQCLTFWSASSSRACKLRLTKRTCKNFPKDFVGLCGSFLAGDNHFLAGSKAGEVFVFHIPTMSVMHQEKIHEGAITGLVVHPNHTQFATCSADKTLKMTDLWVNKETKAVIFESGKPLCNMADEGRCCAFSPDGRYVAVGLLNSTIEVRYSDTFKLFLTLYGHKLPITCLSYPSDGTIIASVSADRTVKIWDTEFGNIVKGFIAHDDAVIQCRFIGHTHYLATGGKDGRLRFWDIDTKEMIMSFDSFCGKGLACLVADQNGDQVFAAGMDKTLRVWKKTEEQFVLSEERAKEAEAELDRSAVREDFENHGEVAILERPTRASIETVTESEKLMDKIELAWAELEAEEKFLAEIEMSKLRREELRESSQFSGLENSLCSSSVFGVSRPTPNVELLGKTPHEFVLDALKSVRFDNLCEILLGVPFQTARKLLVFICDQLEAYSNLAETGDPKYKNLGCAMPIEQTIETALYLVQAHSRFFINAEDDDGLTLIRLQKYLRPALKACINQMESNNVVLTMLLNTCEKSPVAGPAKLH